MLGRDRDEDVQKLLEAHGYEVHFVEGDDPLPMHQAFAATLDTCYAKIRAIQTAGAHERLYKAADLAGHRVAQPQRVDRAEGRRWPAGRGNVSGSPGAAANVRDNPAHLQMLEQWMRSYQPEDLFDKNGRLVAELAALAPKGDRRMGANPHANGGKLTVDLDLPAFRDYAIPVTKPATERRESTRQLGKMIRDIFQAKRATKRTSGSSVPTRRTRTGWETSSKSRTAVRSARSFRSTTTWPPTAG